MEEIELTKTIVNRISKSVISAAIEVHTHLGPGLLEPVYRTCLEYELSQRKIKFKSEFIVPVKYGSIMIDAALRCDFLIGQSVVVEIKAVEEVLPIHEAQLLTYMKLLNVPKGIIINFNCTNLFYEGQKTYVNKLFASLDV